MEAVGAAFSTRTPPGVVLANGGAGYVPSSSVAEARTVYSRGPSAYTCVADDGLPGTVSTFPSPQSTVQWLIVSAPGSAEAASSSVYVSPSTVVVGPVAESAGATLV